MPDTGLNVLRVNDVQETSDYQKAVAQIILNIQNATGHTYIQIGETISASLGTISNAANKKGVLNVLYLARIGQAYGAHFLNPYLALMGARAVALNAEEVDPLPSLTRATNVIAIARSPNSEGGINETPSEKSQMLPILEEAQNDLCAKIVSIKAALA